MTYQQQGNYPGPQQQGGYPGPVARQGNGLAIAGMVCGIVGLLLFNVILGPLAVIFGGIGLSRANKGAPHKGQAIAGIVLGIIDLVIFAIIVAEASKHGGYFYFHTG